MVAVEVRQGTQSADGRGSGPAGNTERRWSRLPADTGHGGWRLRADSTTTEETKEEEEDTEAEEKADIKSNNPHLTGGEKGACGFSSLVVFCQL